MKNTRRGLGKGLGVGYKNIVPLDKHIHSLSAKGLKTYITVNVNDGQIHTRAVNNEDAINKARAYLEKRNHKLFFNDLTAEKTDFSRGYLEHLEKRNFILDAKNINWGMVVAEYQDMLRDYGETQKTFDWVKKSNNGDAKLMALEYQDMLRDYGETEKTFSWVKKNSLNAKNVPKGWVKIENNPKNDGDFQHFLTYKKGNVEIEVTRYYDEDKHRYDKYYEVYKQVANKEGDSWDGQELGTFTSLKKAKAFALKMAKVYLKAKGKKSTCPVCAKGWKTYGGDYDSLCDKHYLQIEPNKVIYAKKTFFDKVKKVITEQDKKKVSIYMGDLTKIGGLTKTRKQKKYPYTKREKELSLATVGGAGAGFVVGGLVGGLGGMMLGVPIGSFAGNIIGRKVYPKKGRPSYYQPSIIKQLTTAREDLLKEKEDIYRVERARAKAEREETAEEQKDIEAING